MDTKLLNEMYKEFCKLDRDTMVLRTIKTPGVNHIRQKRLNAWRKWYKFTKNSFYDTIYKMYIERNLQKINRSIEVDLITLITLIKFLIKKRIIAIETKSKNIIFKKEIFPRNSEKSIDWNLIKKSYRINPTFDQLPCDIGTTKRRARKILLDTPLWGKKVLLLGDDDLTSIALAAISPAEIHVIDIDANILGLINSISCKYQLGITTHQHNLCRGVPKKLIKEFDIFVTDPPGTYNGTSLFLYRARQALNNKFDSRGYLSMSSLGKKQLHIERYILSLGFKISEIHPFFNYYPILVTKESSSQGLNYFLDEREVIESASKSLNIPQRVLESLGYTTHLFVLKLVNPAAKVESANLEGIYDYFEDLDWLTDE